MKIFVGAIASVAVAMRVAKGASELLAGGSNWVFEECGKFIYGIDVANPENVAIYFSDFNHPISICDVNFNARLEYSEVEKNAKLEDQYADKLKWKQYVYEKYRMCADDIATTRYARAVYSPIGELQTDFMELCANVNISRGMISHQYRREGKKLRNIKTGWGEMEYADIALSLI